MPKEKEYLTKLSDMFISNGGKFYFVELSSDIETRLKRNETPHRIERKASKKNIEWSRANLINAAHKHKLNSDQDEIWFENHIKIDNSNLEPDEVADMVIKAFNLVANIKEEKEYRFGL